MAPFISVIIPVYNDCEGLKHTISCLEQQDYDKDLYEVVVVDNGSNDGTHSKAEVMARKSRACIKVVLELKKGSYAARNRGIHEARGDLLCFLDADMIVGSDYLSRVADHFQLQKTDYLGCRVALVERQKTIASKYEQVFAFPVQEYMENLCFAPTCCLSIRRSVIDRVGLFDARLESGGDLFFGRRVHLAGLCQAYTDQIVVHHPTRCCFASLLKKAERLARGHTQLSYYFPNEFGMHFRGQISPLNLLPLRWKDLLSKLRSRGIDATFHEKILLVLFPIPLRALGAIAALKEKARLKQRALHSDRS